MTARGEIHAARWLGASGESSRWPARPRSATPTPWAPGALVGLIALALGYEARAQSADPPPGAAIDPPPAAAVHPSPSPADTTPAEAAVAPVPAETPGLAPATAPPGTADYSTEGLVQAPYSGSLADSGIVPDRSRDESQRRGVGLAGSTGLLRVQSASTGSPGTFRIALVTGLYSGSNFLCPSCRTADGQSSSLPDQTDRVAAHFFLSATPSKYLEVYGGIYSYSTATNRPIEQLKQVVGDWSLGVKGLWLEPEVGRVFSAGGSADVAFATGSGQVGVSGIGSVNLGLRGVVSADLNQMASSALPVKLHANLGYLFDNSGKLIEEYETSSGRYVERIERFSLDINRVDSIPFGIGAELTLDGVRPFAEWTADIPITHVRGNFRCVRATAELYPGDDCMKDAAGFSSTPSRLTVGARVMPWDVAPWWMDGVSLVGALDIGTGAVSDFLVEVAPEAPFSVWFGLSMAGDTQPQVVVQQVPMPIAPPPEPEALRVHGVVLEKDTDNPIADALIRFEGRDLTGLITTASGQFITSALDPGLYTFRITAEGYRDGTCSVEVLGEDYSNDPMANRPIEAWDHSAHGALSSPNARPDAAAEDDPPGLRCELEPLPLVSNLNGQVKDFDSNQPVPTAVATITDVLGRKLELQVDELGAFRFQNVPPGACRVAISAEGYLPSVTELNVEAPRELDRSFNLFPVPAETTVRPQETHLMVEGPLDFQSNPPELTPASLRTIQQLAAYLLARPELGIIEVQGHAVAGAEESTLRANAVRDALLLHGVSSDRLTATGYGATIPPAEDKMASPDAKIDRIQFARTKANVTSMPF